MKKMISLSVFIIMILMVVLVKASQAQTAIPHSQTTTVPRVGYLGIDNVEQELLVKG
jgi:hypothetical protein